MFAFARDVGAHLDCGWMMTVEPGMFKRAFSKRISGSPLTLSKTWACSLNRIYPRGHTLSTARFARLVRELMVDMEQDVTGMTTSKGFLSVW